MQPRRLLAVIRAHRAISAELQHAVLHAVHAAVAPLSQGVSGGGQIYKSLETQLIKQSES